MKPDEFKLKKELAVALATNAHAYKTKDGKPQTYDGKPYTVHLMAVEINLKRFGIDSLNGERDQNLLIGAWLHDTLEDTTVSYDEILNEFGKDIADLVYSVTNESGANRKERSLKTYPKISAHPYAVILKLADRLANTEASVNLEKEGYPGLITMYRKEYGAFKESLYQPGVADEMWNELDRLTLQK